MKIADYIYDTNWYELPLEIQKRISTLIEVNNQPQYLSGYDVFIASHQSFKAVHDHKNFFFKN